MPDRQVISVNNTTLHAYPLSPAVGGTFPARDFLSQYKSTPACAKVTETKYGVLWRVTEPSQSAVSSTVPGDLINSWIKTSIQRFEARSLQYLNATLSAGKQSPLAVIGAFGEPISITPSFLERCTPRNGVIFRNNRVAFMATQDQSHMAEFVGLRGKNYGSPDTSFSIRPMNSNAVVTVYRLGSVLPKFRDNGSFFAIRIHEIGARALDIDLVTTAFRFSPAESLLVGDLLKGETIASHARSRGISVETAKSHAQNLYRKTDTQNLQNLLITVCSL